MPSLAAEWFILISFFDNFLIMKKSQTTTEEPVSTTKAEQPVAVKTSKTSPKKATSGQASTKKAEVVAPKTKSEQSKAPITAEETSKKPSTEPVAPKRLYQKPPNRQPQRQN